MEKLLLSNKMKRAHGVCSIIEGGGKYKNYDYLIFFVSFLDWPYRLAYVALPAGHSINKTREDDINLPVCCHGGISFNSSSSFLKDVFVELDDERWIGFDAMQGGDMPDFDCGARYFPEIDYTNKRAIIMHEFRNMPFKRAIRDYCFMEEQCKSIIDQLIEMDENYANKS